MATDNKKAYTPTLQQLALLKPAFYGASSSDDFYAPCLMPNDTFTQALSRLFDSSADILKSANREKEHGVLVQATELADSRLVKIVVNDLAQSKARLMNHYSLCKKLPNELIENESASLYQQEAFRFVLELLEQNHNTRNFLVRYFEFSKQEIALFERFIAQTVIALFAMGYPDAAHHSSQVARLCVVKAAKNKATRSELLQSVMVGWLHDPKLLNILSIDNLSTHPVIASAIAYAVLTEETMYKYLTKYLKADATAADIFIAGVTDALSVNNDSRFVAERFIYDQIKMQINRYQGKELGAVLSEELWETHQQRLGAPAKNVQPQQFSENLERAIAQTSLDSGFIGIKKAAWKQACLDAGAIHQGDNTDADAEYLYRAAANGQTKDKSILSQVTTALLKQHQESKQPMVRWLINGLHLFSHHDEVSDSGRQAALALVCSDPLMLSPHKILEVRPNEEPLLRRLNSYMFSLKSNINDLPYAAKPSALTWQRSILLCLLKTAKKVSGGPQLNCFYEEHQYTSIENDIEALEALILQEETWGEYATLTSKGADEVQFAELLDIFKMEYLEMCQYYRDAVLAEDVDEAKIF